MTVKDDVLRALDYGKGSYYAAITSVPSYQAELARVRTDYNERTWIDFKGFLPKFTTAEFEKRRIAYQAKYGNSVNVPGFSDVIHIVPKAQISAEERAAHLWATKRGLPSPLTPAQIESLAYKKFRFLNALASATPAWFKNYGAVATVLDNVEDGLVTVVVLGRIAAKIAPRLLGRMVPGLGWVLLGSDILNAVNLVSWGGAMTGGCKKFHEEWQRKNPFHAKAAANRAFRIKSAVPSVGEILEILQTTDQLFGVGLCLGGFMGLVTDAVATTANPAYWQNLWRILYHGSFNELSVWVARSTVHDVVRVRNELRGFTGSFWDEAARLKDWDQNLRQRVFDWTKAKEKETWGWVKTLPEFFLKGFSYSLIGSMIMSTGKDDFLKEDHTKAFMMLNASIEGLIPWWIENDPLANFKGLRDWKIKAPGPTDPSTIDMLNEYNPGWEETVRWPHIDKEYATIEEILFNYAPRIKDSFQTYALNYRHEWGAYVAASQVVDFVENVIRSFDDNNEVRIGYTAYVAVAIDMMDQRYIMPPDTSGETIEALADYIGNYERQTGVAPKIHDVAKYGSSIGIEWMRTFPKRAFDAAAEIFPEWQAIQDQLDDLFVSD